MSARTPRGTTVLPPNRVISVRVNAHEEVRWIWTHTIGGSYVSGYTIVNVRSDKRAKRTKRD